MVKTKTLRFTGAGLFMISAALIVMFSSPRITGKAAGQQPGAIGRAQQPLPLEQEPRYAFPRAWGELHSVVASARGINYVLVASDGTIRVVEATDVSVNQIQVIPRR